MSPSQPFSHAVRNEDAYYRGEIADATVRQLGSLGGSMTAADLAEHRGEWVQPLRATYRNVEVVELPPNTQGITALEALKIVEACGPLPPDGRDQQHRLIEAVKDCLVRSECVGPLVLELLLPNSSS